MAGASATGNMNKMAAHSKLGATKADRAKRKILARLVSQQAGEFRSQLAKLLGADLRFTHQADFVADEGEEICWMGMEAGRAG